MRACSGVEETNDSARESTCSYMERNLYQSTPESKGRRRRKAYLLPFSVEEELVERYDNDNTDGDVRSTSRKDARKYQSPDLYAAMPRSSAKS
jgi:hypothetical protein